MNFFWGVFNVLFGLFLLARHPLSFVVETPLLLFVAGVLVMGAYLSTHFAKVQAKSPVQQWKDAGSSGCTRLDDANASR